MELKDVIGLLRNAEPVLKDPEKITDEILRHVTRSPRINLGPRLYILQRLLVAASVALLLVFGYEQTIVVRDMQSLEIQMDNVHEYNQLQNINLLQGAVTRLNAGFSFTEIEQLLSGWRSGLPVPQRSGSPVHEQVKKQIK